MSTEAWHKTRFVTDDWMVEAACVKAIKAGEADRDDWFPERGGDGRTARAICDSCPVKVDCLDYALSLGSDIHGTWGGKSERERRRIRRDVRKAGRAI